MTVLRRRSLVQVLASALCLLAILPLRLRGAQSGGELVRIRVSTAGQAIEGATVSIRSEARPTDASGETVFTLPLGTFDGTVVKDGFARARFQIVVTAGTSPAVEVELRPSLDEDVTVVGATRNDRRVGDQAMRVDVLPREEIEEKLLMTPGDIVMMLNEMGGMRVQATSPSLGAASVRVQGMRGRYTRVLSDGLPLYGDVGGIGLLQIPPMDLGQVEVIKGVASALYGGSAMGGVINLVSRRPQERVEREFLFNRSARGATDATAYFGAPLGNRWSGTLLAGGHWHTQNDIDGDGWADLPAYERAVIRPRLYWDNRTGSSLFLTAGLTDESRTGGTVDGAQLPGTTGPYVESLDTQRLDVGGVGQTLVGGRFVISARGSFLRQRHAHVFGENLERDRHTTGFAEMTVRTAAGRHAWVAGVAFQRDVFRTSVPGFGYTFNAPGVFGQYDVDLNRAFTLSASGRLDVHCEYGSMLSPRLSLLARREGWNSRLSVGTGFFASTPLTEEAEAAGLTRLTVVRPLAAERGVSASWDLTKQMGPLAITGTLFTSRVTNPLHVDRSPAYILTNLEDPTRNLGLELLGTWRSSPFALTGTYTYVRARQTVDRRDADVPLTPRHSAGLVGMWEVENGGRVGVEFYVTGRQRLDDNPFRTVSAPYASVGVLAERRVGRLRVFINGENLTDTRQTRWDSLLTPSRGADGRWAVDAWSPLEGRNVNGGVRLIF